MKRVVVFGLLLILATACGSYDEVDQAVENTPARSTGEAAEASENERESVPEEALDEFVSFTYEAQEAMGFCPENFLEAEISRTDQDQFEFSATLVEEVSEDEGQSCLETGMVKCMVAEPLKPRILDGDESRLVLDTFASLAFGEVPDWCEDIAYDPCRIDIYSWDFEDGELLQARGDICHQPHLAEDSQTALQQLLVNLAGQSERVSSEEEADPGGINQG